LSKQRSALVSEYPPHSLDVGCLQGAAISSALNPRLTHALLDQTFSVYSVLASANRTAYHSC